MKLLPFSKLQDHLQSNHYKSVMLQPLSSYSFISFNAVYLKNLFTQAYMSPGRGDYTHNLQIYNSKKYILR